MGHQPSRTYTHVNFTSVLWREGKSLPNESEWELAAASATHDSITLSWQPVDKAVEYQLFEYFENTGLLQMLHIFGRHAQFHEAYFEFSIAGVDKVKFCIGPEHFDTEKVRKHKPNSTKI